MKKQHLFLLSLLLLFVFSSFASAECSVYAGACPATYSHIMYVSNWSNAHAATVAGYGYTLCCDDIGPGVTDTLVYLSATNDAHVQQDTVATYPVQIQVNDHISYRDGGCGTATCIMTISGDDNAHVANCSDPGNYTRAVCIGLPNEMRCGSVNVNGVGLAPACDQTIVAAGTSADCGVGNTDWCVYRHTLTDTAQCFMGEPNRSSMNAPSSINCLNDGETEMFFALDSVNVVLGTAVVRIANTSIIPPVSLPKTISQGTSVLFEDMNNYEIGIEAGSVNAAGATLLYSYPRTRTLNANGRIIECDGDANNDGGNYNVWCPEGYGWDAVLGRCYTNSAVCDQGFLPTVPATPLLNCTVDPTRHFTDYPVNCFDDYVEPLLPTEIPPYSESCCYDFNWTAPIGEDYTFYARPNSIQVY